MRNFISTFPDGHDLRLDDLGFIQQAYREIIDEILSSDFMKAGISNPANPFVLRGITQTGNTFTRGSIFWNGEVYLVDDQSITGSGTLYWEKVTTYDPASVTYEDGSVRQVHSITKLRPTYTNPGSNGFANAVLQRYVNPLIAFDSRLDAVEAIPFARRDTANIFEETQTLRKGLIIPTLEGLMRGLVTTGTNLGPRDVEIGFSTTNENFNGIRFGVRYFFDQINIQAIGYGDAEIQYDSLELYQFTGSSYVSVPIAQNVSNLSHGNLLVRVKNWRVIATSPIFFPNPTSQTGATILVRRSGTHLENDDLLTIAVNSVQYSPLP